jgi:hypothetical protein
MCTLFRPACYPNVAIAGEKILHGSHRRNEMLGAGTENVSDILQCQLIERQLEFEGFRV